MGSEQPTSSGGVFCSLEAFLEDNFDYVVVGGGTAGLVVAARLSEDPSVRVGLLEAGQNRLGDPLVETPGTLAFLLRNPEYAWDFTTLPQEANKNKTHHVTRGKVLGGSSAINFMAYGYPSARDLDDLKELGISSGWSWDEMAPYYRKVEHYDPPTRPEPDIYPIDGANHGTQGAIHTSYATTRFPAEDALLEALKETSGLTLATEPYYSGEHQGWYGGLSTIDRSSVNRGTRSYAATGYVAPTLLNQRPNLKILTEATATKVILVDDDDDDSSRTAAVAARGVAFAHGGRRDRLHTVHVRAEVILSAGTIQTPQLLELSGIGDPSILRAAGIEPRVENPHVGSNAQEQIMTNVSYELADGETSLDSIYLDPAFLPAQQRLYAESREGVLANAPGLNGFTSYSSLVDASTLARTVYSLLTSPPPPAAAPSSASSSAQQPSPKLDSPQAAILASRLASPSTSAIQYVVIPAYCDTLNTHADMSKFMPGPPPSDPPRNPCISLQVVLMYPCSRGSVHITSADPLAPPGIDFALLSHPADVDVLAAGLAFADRAFRSPHITSRVKSRLYPPEGVDVQDLNTARDTVREAVTLINHPVGTCALGKVVDERLRVIGVKGLRVVDASVLPMELSAFPMATVYAIGEKGAVMINEDRVVARSRIG
ncbi:uncharacterized protein Z520_09404 [Fonsecaea multimorphosa CBS 102226]|uniref:Glucose-methanol-choline oxidoreductase N-terminal domain-containing protein n=1 Tax=Fonsecaea multimorphosa CBS 102226 TaxID=1442371 RepID=A0A0D2JW33_9EURO|nr:uncharacterized protein Z520_09404 [Fonsecaea multimorphosa CBS 102226]KIX94714.1 hypothetical protein Z520_09404 [Fonsecaea multimorphosa CBS 102226]OAL20489.1 hypothetical protein AYO22_08790 [Fonsecaea multimorphosa]